MLDRIRTALEQADRAITTTDLALSLGIERSALEPMLELLVRSGILKDSALQSDLACGGMSDGAGCSSGGSCDPIACPFIMKLPRSMSLS